MAEDVQYDYNYHISDENIDSDETDHLESVSSASPEDLISPRTSDILPENSYLLYAFIADHATEDEFASLANNFISAKEDFKNGVQTTVVFTLLSVFLFTICNVVSGRRGNEETFHLHFYDRIYTELILLAIAGLSMIPYLLWKYIGRPYWGTSLDRFIASYPKYHQWATVFLGGLALFLSLMGLFYFSLIRRIKSKTLLSSSFLGRFVLLPLKKLFHFVVNNLRELYRSLPSLGKTIMYLCLGILWLGLSVCMFLTNNHLFGLIALLLGALLCALLCLRNMLDRARITQTTAQMSAGNLSARIPTTSMLPSNKNLSEDINQICDGLHFAVEEQTKSERMKTELITNVSHDIKTPLTSIINYIELIKNELPQEGAVAEYAEILSQKSWRLKALIDDLVEASKAASGTMKLEPIRFNAVELLRQAIGDFEERLTEQNLTLCVNVPETPVTVLADGACTHRIIENMLSNVCKYALAGTRVFVSLDLPENTSLALLTVKNTSASVLTKTPEELLTRFSRGNDDRSGEGSGLGLSIAESLATLQGGSFQIEIDGDLFKAKLAIPLAE
jgi:signal transduction histidine kinase